MQIKDVKSYFLRNWTQLNELCLNKNKYENLFSFWIKSIFETIGRYLLLF